MEEKNTIAIIGAMESEISSLKNMIVDREEVTIAEITFYSGKLYSKDVLIFKSGMGKVNAAIGATIAIEKFGAKSIIFTGVAGSVDENINILDIVISDTLIEYDYDITAMGKPLGHVEGSINGKFYADKKLIEIALKSAANVMGENRVKVGVIATGDQFIASKEKVKWLKNTFNASAVEMEGASVAHVATVCKIPFVVIRSMSDKADGTSHIDFRDFVIEASEHSVNIVKNILQSI